MMMLWSVSMTLLVGLTAGGLVGSALEAATGARLRLGAPFIRRRGLALSLAVAAVTGPYMLVNEALAASRRGTLRPWGVAMAGALALAWLAATGVLIVELAILAARM